MIRRGDVIVSRNKSWASWFIRLAAWLRGDPGYSHVIVAHHRDDAGRLWGLEAKAEGVGWTVITATTLRDTLNNSEQPKTWAQRDEICRLAKGLLDTPYDWTGIVLDGMEAISAQEIWTTWGDADTTPSAVVCSSYADWLYDRVGLASPGAKYDRTVTPGDWADFILTRGWES